MRKTFYFCVQIRTAYPEQDYKHGEMLNEFPVSGYHYYCESADVTRPFPSDCPVTQPSWEFVWNYYLTQPFRRVGLPEIAPPILQVWYSARSVCVNGDLRVHVGTSRSPR